MTNYEIAKEKYAAVGVDVENALAILDTVPLSIHCWQGDDVRGFEKPGVTLTGGIAATGNYPGRARNLDELRADIEFALTMIPGPSKVNLHASYLYNGGAFVDRDEIDIKHFASWADWAVRQKLGLDFNSTFFSHDKSEKGTLTNPDQGIREFWIEHAIRCRKIGKFFGEKTGQVCVNNLWIPDGAKEIPIDTLSPRMRLKKALDTIFEEKIDPSLNRDAVESKLFGIGAEAYTPGSNEFYVSYAVQNPDVLLTMDAGHYHPTEVISAKISAMLCFVDELLLHVSRPVRWDSDHVVLLDDETRQIMREIVRADALGRVYIASDYFDASINRAAAWCIGSRNARKALLAALLEPVNMLRGYENEGNNTASLLIQQEMLTYPMGDVWAHYCQTRNVAENGLEIAQMIARYEKDVLSRRV